MIVRKLFNETMFTISDNDYEYELKDVLVHGDKLDLGGYTWSRIGNLDGHNLYLCDEVVRNMMFNSNGMDNSWSNSDIRKWLNANFYNTLSDDEKEIILKNRELNDKIFLLSLDEYNNYEFRKNIKPSRMIWWTRSPGTLKDEVIIVQRYGQIRCYDVDEEDIGVRPAVLI